MKPALDNYQQLPQQTLQLQENERGKFALKCKSASLMADRYLRHVNDE
jgi:hypothetical protein